MPTLLFLNSNLEYTELLFCSVGKKKETSLKQVRFVSKYYTWQLTKHQKTIQSHSPLTKFLLQNELKSIYTPPERAVSSLLYTGINLHMSLIRKASKKERKPNYIFSNWSITIPKQ
jgi:hypothetical protein